MLKRRCKECGEPAGWFQEKKQRKDNATGLRFFKILIGDFTSKLCIPPAFANHIRVNKCATATLNNRTSIPWPVKVHRKNNLLFLRDGWREFVEHHSLQYGDFLVFKHNGDLDFDVQIFGRSGCERVGAYLAKSGKVHKMEGETKKPRGPSKDPLNGSLVLEGAMGNKPLNPGKALSFSDHPAYKSTYRYASRRREVTKEERLKALDAAHNLNLSRPHFTATMTETNVYRRFILTIPRRFFIRFRLNSKVTLRSSNDMSWQVGCRYDTYGRAKFIRGWGPFSLANNLEEGDVCVFELTEGDSVIDVHIFRVVDEVTALFPCEKLHKKSSKQKKG